MIKYIGKRLKLEVKDQTDLGYTMVDKEGEEFFLHSKQANGAEVGTFIDCFIYVDKQKRLTATAEKPVIAVGESGFLEVKEVNKRLGVFVHNGVVKDVLVSKNDLPQDYRMWPKVDDKVFVTLNATYTNLVCKPVHYNEVNNIIKVKEIIDQEVKAIAYVLWIGEAGINLATEEGHSIFIHKTNYRGSYRIGQRLEVQVTHMKNKSEYNGTLIDKATTIKSDADIVYEYMKNHRGQMRFTAKTDADLIMEIFSLSKGAFKRAVSNLYKERKIDQNEKGWFIVE